MSLNFRAIANVLSAFIAIQGIAMLPCLIASIIYNEKNMILIFSEMLLCEAITGSIIFRKTKRHHKSLKLRDGFMSISLCYFLGAIIGAFPFLMFFINEGLGASASSLNFIDALFESTSVITTTGATVFSLPELLPRSLLFYRSYGSWLAGFAIIFMPLVLFSTLGLKGLLSTKSDVRISFSNNTTTGKSNNAKYIISIFLSFTVLLALLLYASGMSPFDAITHAFSTIGTGGFSNYSESIGFFNSPSIAIILAIFMILSGINYSLYFVAFSRKTIAFFREAELSLYLLLTALATICITLYLHFSNILAELGIGSNIAIITSAGTSTSFFNEFISGFFAVASAISTTGFHLLDNDTMWGAFPKLLILTLMLIGGCTFSASGGLKSIRILYLFKMIHRGILIRLHPNAIIDIKANGRKIPISTLQAVFSYIFIYLGIIVLGSFLLSLGGVDALSSITSTIACIGNTGASFGMTGPTLDYSQFMPYAKVLLSLIMIAGRVELIAILVLFSPHFWNPDH